MPDSLPRFRRGGRDYTLTFAQEMLTNPFQMPPKSHLIDLIEHEDAHYRIIFDPAYFNLPEGETAPSKSQWNNLKKKFKRHNAQVFLFKEHGEVTHNGQRAYYLDFGFFFDPVTNTSKRPRTPRSG
ncbi:MAG: hypothetical protein SF162_11625 [bacterium]|nr:hypothetical protein [bacterium]